MKARRLKGDKRKLLWAKGLGWTFPSSSAYGADDILRTLEAKLTEHG